MSDTSERYRRVAGAFTERVRSVPDDAWDNPAPCDGWDARDVVRHLVEWIPSFFANNTDVRLALGPAVDDDPVGAWQALDVSIQALLDDPDAASREYDLPMGRMTLESAIGMICIGDVLVHTWDLARATGLDDSLDSDEVHGMLAGMEPMDEMLRTSGHYGPRVVVPEDADEQTRLIAFTGRRP